MRTTTVAIVLGLLSTASCSSKRSNSEPGKTPTPDKPPAVVKKPVDTRPLPPLAGDPGGATGKPLRATGFGGLGIDSPRSIAVADHELYVAGYFDGEIDFGGTIGKRTPQVDDSKKAAKPTSDAYLLKIDKDGKIAWAHTFGAKRDDTANAVAIKGDQVVVVGNFLDEIKLGEFTKKSAGSDDAYVVAFDRAGGFKWAWNFGGIDSDGANAVAATPDGGWVIGGSFSRAANFGSMEFVSRGGTDAMLLKIGASGDLEWAKQFGGAYADTIMHVAVDGQGAIVVQGQFKDVADWGGPKKLTAGGGSDNDVVLAKYDLNGDHVWSQRFGNAFNDVAGGVTIDPSGYITMVGSFDRSVTFGDELHASRGESDIYVARFKPSGKLVWARTYGADREDIAYGVSSDLSGNTVTTGWFQNTIDFGGGELTSVGNKDVFALKLDAKGGLIWAQRFGDKDHDQGRAVAIAEDGKSYIAGIQRFKFDAVSPPLESKRAEGDRIPKPDAFVLELDR